MGTWHQKRSGVRLFDRVKFNVVIDPPNKPMCIIQCDTLASAEEVKKKHEHSYILKPEVS